MSTFIKGVAWLGIALGALGSVHALTALARQRSSRRRHRRAVGRGAGWYDLRAYLTIAAVGASVLGDLSTDRSVQWLASLPIFVIVIVNLGLWTGSRIRGVPRGSAGNAS
jgi:hypothetical protein